MRTPAGRWGSPAPGTPPAGTAGEPAQQASPIPPHIAGPRSSPSSPPPAGRVRQRRPAARAAPGGAAARSRRRRRRHPGGRRSAECPHRASCPNLAPPSAGPATTGPVASGRPDRHPIALLGRLQRCSHGPDLQQGGDRLPRRAARVAGRQSARPEARRRRRGRTVRLEARLAAPSLRRRLGRPSLADRVRRPRRHPDRIGDLLRRDRARTRAPAGQRPRRCCWAARRS